MSSGVEKTLFHWSSGRIGHREDLRTDRRKERSVSTRGKAKQLFITTSGGASEGREGAEPPQIRSKPPQIQSKTLNFLKSGA